jgi:hypothetical protein
VIPRAVYDEVVIIDTDLPGVQEVKTPTWIEVRDLKEQLCIDY